jgi:hypothetical protein
MIPFANARGIARIILPGEEKEYYDWMKIATETFSTYTDKGLGAGALQFLRSSGNYAMGKLAPPYQAIKDWMAGTYFNATGKIVKIIPTPSGIKDWLMQEFGPIFINSWDKNAKIGLNWLENATGLREAPKWFENWDAWRVDQQKLHNSWTKQELVAAASSEGASSVGSSGRGLGEVRVARDTSAYSSGSAREPWAAGRHTPFQSKGIDSYTGRTVWTPGGTIPGPTGNTPTVLRGGQPQQQPVAPRQSRTAQQYGPGIRIPSGSGTREEVNPNALPRVAPRQAIVSRQSRIRQQVTPRLGQ